MGGGIFCISVILNLVLYYIMSMTGITRFDVIGYANPLVVIGAAGLTMWAANLRIGHSKIINFTAASSFAVFLFHANPNIGVPIYKHVMALLYSNYSGITYLFIAFTTLTLVFMLSILIDQPRKWLWNICCNIYSKSSQ